MPERSIISRIKRLLRGPSLAIGSERADTNSFMRSLDAGERTRVERAQPYSMVGPERLVANMDAVAYIIKRRVPGALVECGVWRGGSVLAMILTLQDLGVTDRDVYLFDTFEGMTEPSKHETSRFSEPALETWTAAQREGRVPWEPMFGPDEFDLEGVRNLIAGTGYPSEHLHFIVGRVEETLPDRAPERIALLRLDTDWYDSTVHELKHLYPRLASGGVLIVDDYGHWDGCRKAVDEYFSTTGPDVLLARIDYSARMAVKP